MIDLIKKLFCNHEYVLTKWHWTHGVNGNDPAFIEAMWKCRKCGKVRFFYTKGDSEQEHWYESTQRDKKW